MTYNVFGGTLSLTQSINQSVKGQLYSETGKVTLGLAIHWSCIIDFVMQYIHLCDEREMTVLAMPSFGYGTL